MEGSSFETLEALGYHLIREVRPVMASFISAKENSWRARVSINKPSAIPFAETPVVEIRQDIKGTYSM